MLASGLTWISIGVFVVYISHSVYTLYALFHPQLCHGGKGDPKCLTPMIMKDDAGEWPPMQLRIYASTSSNPRARFTSEVHRLAFLDIGELSEFEVSPCFDSIVESAQVNVELPQHTRNNGTLYMHCFILPAEAKDPDPFKSQWRMLQSSRMTAYQVPVAETFQLMREKVDDSVAQEDDTNQRSARQLRDSRTPVSHFRSVLPLTVVAESLFFDARQVPAEVLDLIVLDENPRFYFPIFYIDKLSFRVKDLKMIQPNTSSIAMTVQLRPVSIGKLRLLITALHSLEQLKAMGFSDKDVDEVKGIFIDTNFYFLALTVFVAALHLLLDVLAFKNDISFWRNRKTMVGLSTRTLLWRCFSQSIIFLYLLEEETSLLVLIPAGFGAIVEYWKVTKALKISFVFRGGLPRLQIGASTTAELETEAFDSEAMKYLALLMTPLCVGGAVYSLAYVPHKSWYGWVIECLANGVYAFGFLFMLPQLFVNYKLKSVAHLPWRAFMYKAFNTFIDDMFAFIITMPTAHRVACFRDDIVFLVYLYQRYLYPVDKTRVNEYGESFDKKAKKGQPLPQGNGAAPPAKGAKEKKKD